MIIYGLACLVLETHKISDPAPTMDEQFKRAFNVREEPFNDNAYADW
jgi:hypothetical protein